MTNNSHKKVTLKSIAQELGVSFSTVSKSLNGHPSIGEETRKLVQEKARELGYSPNLLARGLRTNSIKTIAAIFNDIENPVLAYIFKTISVAMAKNGYTTLISDSQFDITAERATVESAISRMVDYVIIAPATQNYENIELLLEHTKNVIVFDAAHPQWDCHFVEVDYAYGGYISACELLSKGHREILIISEPLSYPYSSYYIGGIKKAFAEYEVEFDPARIRHTHSSMERACSTVLSLWDSGKHAFQFPFTAVMCFGDNFALGVYKAAGQLGLSIPDDLSVIGFDNNEICDFTAPTLTSVHLPRERMAQACLEILQTTLIEKEDSGFSLSLSPHLVSRSSVKKIY